MLLPVLSAISIFGANPVAQVVSPPLIHPIAESVASKPATAQIAVPLKLREAPIANLLPDDAIGVILIDTTAAKWESLSRFGFFPKDFSFPSALYPAPLKVNFYTDVQPWLGEQVAYVYLPAAQPQLTTVAMVKDAAQNSASIARFIDRVKASRVKSVKERQYKGVTILEWEPENPLDILDKDLKSSPLEPSQPSPLNVQSDLKTPIELLPPKSKLTSDVLSNSLFAPKGFAIAVLPNHIISSTSPEAVQQIIDAQAANKVLSNLPAFQRTMARKQTAKSLMVAYGDYEKFYSAILAYDLALLQKFSPGLQLPQLSKESLSGGVYDAIDGYVWAEPDGLHLQMGFNLVKPMPTAAQFTTPNQILGQLPPTNYMVSNSRGLSTLWKAFSLVFETQPTLKPKVEQFRQFSQSLIGLDDREIFSWMDGEYATFAYPTREGFLPASGLNLDLGVGFMVQTSDRKAAETALNKLDRFVQGKFGKTFVNTQPGFTTWDLPSSKKSVLTHGWVKPDTLALLGGAPLSEVEVKPNRTLLQSSNFKAAIAPLPTNNTGYFYVNGGAFLTLVNNSILPIFFGTKPTPYLDDLKATLGSIRSISGTTSINTERVQSDGFMALATTRKEPISSRELVELGQQKLDKGDAAEAIHNFTRALKAEPENADTYVQRGDAYQAEAQKELPSELHKLAIADYTQAIQLNSKNAAAYRGRARVQESQFAYEAALADLDQAIQLEPDALGVYTLRATFRGIVEDYRGAIADADQAIRQDASDNDAYNIRCYARARESGDFKAALPDCDTAINLNSDSAANYSSRCYVRAGLKDKKALEDCDRAFELEPDYAYNYEDRGLAKALLGDQKGALKDLQQAIEIYKKRGDAIAQKRVEKAIQTIGS
jgi:tetratricopeptide (TPR) repeat protein